LSIRSSEAPGDRFSYLPGILNLNNTQKMRKTILILVLVASATALITSCSSYRGSEKSGCKSTQGYVGYGSGR